jgi:hypothetical protein
MFDDIVNPSTATLRNRVEAMARIRAAQPRRCLAGIGAQTAARHLAP